MKKKHLLFNFIFAFILLLSCSLRAADRYWVGGSGNWNTPSHWSQNSGGNPGASVPTSFDNVIFDANSFHSFYEEVVINEEAHCNSMFWANDLAYPLLKGPLNSRLNIYGSLTLSKLMTNDFNGDIFFKSQYLGNIINTAGQKLNGNVFFDGEKATWTLADHLFLNKDKIITLLSGNLFTNNKYIYAGSFLALGKAPITLSLGNSVLILEKIFDINAAEKIKLKIAKAKIQVNRSAQMKRTGTTNWSTKSDHIFDSIWVTVTPPLCNTSCDGIVTVDSVFMDPQCSLSYLWTGGILPPAGVPGNPLSNVCNGTYLITVTDDCSGEEFQQFVVVTAPPPMGNTFNKKRPTCFGDCNGWIKANVIGGTGPTYTYLWDNGQTGQTDTALCASPPSSISVAITDANGCVQNFSTNLLQPQQVNPNAIFTNINCNAFCDGTATANPTGGTGTVDGLAPAASPGGYVYLWSPNNETTQSIDSLCPGLYIVKVTDDSLCTGIDSVTITQPNALLLNPSNSNISCGGACDGTAQVAPSGGTVPYNYTWTASVPGVFTGPSLTNLCPGTYTVVVIDSLGCTDSASFTITEPPVLNTDLTSTNVICFGACDGTATSTPTGGTPPYDFTWSSGGVPSSGLTATISNLCPGQYIVTVTDDNNCTDIDTVNIIEPPLLTATASATDMSCNAVCDGTASVVIGGGTPVYGILWSNGSSSDPITGLCDTVYSVIVTDDNGCQAFDTVTVAEPLLLTVTVNDAETSCGGLCDGQLSAIVNGGTPGYSYTWDDPAPQTTPTATGLCVNTYIVIVNDTNGCTATDTANINAPVVINPNVTATDVTCNGVCNGTATSTPSGGTPPYTYSWSDGQLGNIATGLCGDSIYTVTVTDSLNCTQQQTITINQPPVFSSVAAVTNVTCFDDSTGQSTLTLNGGTPGYNVIWNTVPVQTGLTADSLYAGTYSVQITDTLGCVTFDTIIVSEPAAIQANPIISNVNCIGPCDGTIDLFPTGGNGLIYTYTWSGGLPPTQNQSGLCTGTYTCTITDSLGCSETFTFSVDNVPGPTLMSSITDVICNGSCNGNASVTVTAGISPFTYSWAPGSYTTDSIGDLCAGTYYVSVSDSMGCVTTDTIIINEPAVLLPNSSLTDATCGNCDGIASLSPTGGVPPYTFIWGNGATTSAATDLCAGVHPVTIADSTGCSITMNIAISNSGGPTGETINITDVSCYGINDGAATITPTGGIPPYTYLWIPGGQTDSTLTGMSAGTYNLEVADSNGCIRVVPVIINEPTQITANSVITNADCGICNGSISLLTSGGVGPYNYLWSPGAMTDSTVTGLCEDLYTVIISDASGCTQSISIPVSNTTGPALTISSSNITCNSICDGLAGVVTTGSPNSYTYLWSPGGATTDNISGLCPGTYFVEVTDTATLCSSFESVIITEPDTFYFSIPNMADALCAGICNGTGTVLPTGGILPYTYLWNNAEPTQTAIALCSGTDTVTITDANGCSATQTISISEPLPIIIDTVVTSSTCSNTNDGAINITVTGGTVPYTYQWSGASIAITEDLTDLYPGTYTITITDANDCIDSLTVTLLPIQIINADAGPDTTYCEGSGPVTLTGQGGTTYQWFVLPGMTSIGTDSSVSINPPAGTTSYVLGAYTNSCIDYDTVIVNVNPLANVNAGSDVSIVISESTPIGGNPTGPSNSIYLWSPSEGLNDATIPNPVASPINTTIFYVTITDPNGCSGIDSVLVTIISTVIFPNGITVNGDGINDVWIIDNIDLFPDCIVEVYNRWGEMLFRSPGYTKKWDGTYNGKELPVGTYYYVIDLKDERFKPYTGPITIMR